MISFSLNEHTMVTTGNTAIRRMEERDVMEADRIMRLAFGTFIGLPEPMSFMRDAEFIRPRWKAAPESAFVAEVDGEVAGSNLASCWGSVGFFGPLSVHPKYWEQKTGRRLMDPVMDLFEQWGTPHVGLFTFPHSPKHAVLYQRYGFWPHYLTALMSKPVGAFIAEPECLRYSNLADQEREGVLAEASVLTDRIYDGLNVSREIRAVTAQNLGDTILLRSDRGLAALAICHTGAGTEGGSAGCYIKFAAVDPRENGAATFEQLLRACEGFANERGAERLVAGMNTARIEAYRQMFALGFRTDVQGLTMLRSADAGYNRPGVWAIDDWR